MKNIAKMINTSFFLYLFIWSANLSSLSVWSFFSDVFLAFSLGVERRRDV